MVHFIMKNNEARATSTIECLGGCGGLVTGSCNRIQSRDAIVLVDLGMFQGVNEERSKDGVRRNFIPSSSIARGVTDILDSHAHIDHSGLIPKIYKDGHTPTIRADKVTAKFMERMLKNSADIQNKKNPQNRLYGHEDVEKTFRYLEVADLFEEIEIGHRHSRLTAEFIPNGHIIGSNSILVRNTNKDVERQNILFTGDMGKPTQSLCGGYLEQVSHFPTDPINVLVVESTSFTKEPISFQEKETTFLNEITNTWQNGGNPIIPVLSLHRSQEIIEILHHHQGGLIPNDCHIFIDAPLAMELMEDFKELGPEYLSPRYGDDPIFYKTPEESMARFDLKNVTIIESHKQSIANDIAMANYRGKAIIIASGGMGEHGRAVNYLKGSFCQNPNNAILFTCYQVPGTAGAEITRHKNIKTGLRDGARVVNIRGFTSHISGEEETFGFLKRFNLDNLDTVIINHGKDTSRQAMAEAFKRRGFDGRIILPNIGDKIAI